MTRPCPLTWSAINPQCCTVALDTFLQGFLERPLQAPQAQHNSGSTLPSICCHAPPPAANLQPPVADANSQTRTYSNTTQESQRQRPGEARTRRLLPGIWQLRVGQGLIPESGSAPPKGQNKSRPRGRLDRTECSLLCYRGRAGARMSPPLTRSLHTCLHLQVQSPLHRQLNLMLSLLAALKHAIADDKVQPRAHELTSPCPQQPSTDSQTERPWLR